MKKSLIVLLLLMLIGCNSDNVSLNNKLYEKQGGKKNSQYAENFKAKNMVNELIKIQGIKKAVVVINGTTVLVGLEVQDTSNNTGLLKDCVYQKIKIMDSNLSKVEITTNKDIYKRISKLNDDITNNRPISGIKDDFTNLLKIKF